MHCPHCGSDRIHRTRRTKTGHTLRSWFGQWPYHCRQCGSGFSAGIRKLPVSKSPAQNENRDPAEGTIVECGRVGMTGDIPVYGSYSTTCLALLAA